MSAGPVAAEWLPPTLNGSPSVAAMDWRSRLIRSKTTKDGLGAPKALLANAITALREAPEWKALYHSMNSHSQLCCSICPMGRCYWNGMD